MRPLLSRLADRGHRRRNTSDTPRRTSRRTGSTTSARSVAALAGAAALAGTAVLVAAGPAQAASIRVTDPGTDWGHGTNITRLAASNGTHRVKIRINYLKGAHARYVLSAVHPRRLDAASVIIRRAHNGTVTAKFWILYPESAGDRAPCDGMTYKWRPRKRTVAVSFPQTCYTDATGRKVPKRWYFTAFTGGGPKAGDEAMTKPVRRG